ncbi:MAG: hypothetical protein KGZ25_12360, partial [Planctomycetes bacterium]|nr:hypothetical protein [Planctomycetota bacterium]
MSDEHQEQAFHDHEHFGSLQTRLVITLVGFILIVNAFLADKVFFPGQPAIGAVSSLLVLLPS